jgi:hypothetical protein
MSRLSVLHSIHSIFDRDQSMIGRIHAKRAAFARLSDTELRAAASETEDLPRWIALAATAAFRVLGRKCMTCLRTRHRRIKHGQKNRGHYEKSPQQKAPCRS